MTVRRSGRERRKPENFYQDAKKGRDDDMDEGAEDGGVEEAEENDNEDSGNESDEAYEAQVPVGTLSHAYFYTWALCTC